MQVDVAVEGDDDVGLAGIGDLDDLDPRKILQQRELRGGQPAIELRLPGADVEVVADRAGPFMQPAIGPLPELGAEGGEL